MTNINEGTKNKITLSGSIQDEFRNLMTATGFKGTQPQFLSYLISTHTPDTLFGEQEKKKIDEAASISNMSSEAIIVAGALQYANKIVESVNDGKTGNADIRINNFVNDLMSKNNAAAEWFEKIEITQGLLADKEKGGGFNRVNIQRYLSANRNRIDEHHAKNKIVKDHNRTVANYLRKQTNLKDEG
jgi:hypothetical protein